MGEVHDGSSLVSLPCPWDRAQQAPDRVRAARLLRPPPRSSCLIITPPFSLPYACCRRALAYQARDSRCTPSVAELSRGQGSSALRESWLLAVPLAGSTAFYPTLSRWVAPQLTVVPAPPLNQALERM